MQIGKTDSLWAIVFHYDQCRFFGLKDPLQIQMKTRELKSKLKALEVYIPLKEDLIGSMFDSFGKRMTDIILLKA